MSGPGSGSGAVSGARSGSVSVSGARLAARLLTSCSSAPKPSYVLPHRLSRGEATQGPKAQFSPAAATSVAVAAPAAAVRLSSSAAPSPMLCGKTVACSQEGAWRDAAPRPPHCAAGRRGVGGEGVAVDGVDAEEEGDAPRVAAGGLAEAARAGGERRGRGVERACGGMSRTCLNDMSRAGRGGERREHPQRRRRRRLQTCRASHRALPLCPRPSRARG